MKAWLPWITICPPPEISWRQRWRTLYEANTGLPALARAADETAATFSLLCSELFREKPHQARREEAGKAVRLVDRIAAPIVRRALQNGGAHKESGLLQRQHESIGVGAAIDQIVLGAGAQVYRDLVVGAHRVADRRRIEINLA